MAIVRETAGFRTTVANTSPFDIALAVGSLTGRAVEVVAHNFSGTIGTTVTGVTYDGVALTAGPTGTNGLGRTFSTWRGLVANGTVTTPNIRLTFSAANATFQVFVAAYSGVGSFRDVLATVPGTGTAPTASPSTANGDLINSLGFDGQFNGGTLTASGTATIVASETPSSQAWHLEQSATGGPTSTIGGTLSVGGSWIMGTFVLVPAASSPVLTGSVTLDELLPSGTLASGASILSGTLTLDEILASGAAGLVPGSVKTLPFSRNTGSRPTGLTSVALAVLTDDPNLTKYAGATALTQAADGTITFSNGALPSVGTSVVVITREADGKLGVERYTIQ